MAGENAGAAALAVALAVVGFVVMVAGARGTYLGVWGALTHNAVEDKLGKTAPDTGSGSQNNGDAPGGTHNG